MIDTELQEVIRALINVLLDKSEPLGAEFERVWDENIEQLYEP